MMLLILFGTSFCLVFYYYCIRTMSYWKSRGIKQGNPTWLFGDNLKVMMRKESLMEMVQRIYNEHPGERCSGMYQFLVPTLIVRDLELIKQVTVKDFDHFVDHTNRFPEEAEPLWSRNLLTLKGQKWRDMRSILSPSFTSSKMKMMFVLISKCAETFVEYFQNQENDIVEVEMRDVLTRYGNDVIASAAFGVNVNSLVDNNNEFYVMGKEATDFSGFRKTLAFFGYFIAPKLMALFKVNIFPSYISAFFMKLINETVKVREEKGIVRPDMIHLLMEARKGNDKPEETTTVDTGFATAEDIAPEKKDTELHKKNITNTDIAAQALIFFFAGFDTGTTVMSFLAYELAINPDIQEKLRNEITATHEACNGMLTYEALMKMKYLDMVISESMRKWSAAIAIDRLCTKSYTIPPVSPEQSPILIEKGTILWIPVCGIHLDPQHFPEPQKFDPERFNDENKHKIKPYSYLPFGSGPRNCIGSRFALLECKILMFYLLKSFEVVPVKKTNIPIKIAKNTLNLRAEGGNWLGFKKIQIK